MLETTNRIKWYEWSIECPYIQSATTADRKARCKKCGRVVKVITMPAGRFLAPHEISEEQKKIERYVRYMAQLVKEEEEVNKVKKEMGLPVETRPWHERATLYYPAHWTLQQRAYVNSLEGGDTLWLQGHRTVMG